MKDTLRSFAGECESQSSYAWAVAPTLRKAATFANAVADLRDKYAGLDLDAVPREWIVNDLKGLLK